MNNAKGPCKCKHPLSAHKKHVREGDGMRVEDALLGKKQGDIFSDKPLGESGGTECSCRQWMPFNY